VQRTQGVRVTSSFIRAHIFILIALAATFATSASRASTNGQIFLGPDNTRLGAQWLHGASGGGSNWLDADDPPKSGFDLSMNNSVAGKENAADWRSQPFSLGPAVGGSRAMTFSFAYKFVGPVAKNNNIHVQLRFFDATGTNFISEYVFPIGARTEDSSMTDYKTRVVENIHAPPRARTADVWIDANIFEPWTSGTARFADISLTVAPLSLKYKAGVIALICTAIAASIGLSVYFWRLRARTQP
jgi:hypothetical protein